MNEGLLKKLLLDRLWTHRFIDDSMSRDKFEEAIITDIHEVVDKVKEDLQSLFDVNWKEWGTIIVGKDKEAQMVIKLKKWFGD